MPMKGYSLYPDLQKWILTTWTDLVWYPGNLSGKKTSRRILILTNRLLGRNKASFIVCWRHMFFVFFGYRFIFSVLASLPTSVRFHWSLRWQQIFPGLQDTSRYSSRFQQCCILDGFHSPSDFQSSCFFSRLLEIVLSALATIAIDLTLMFHSLFSSLARSKYLFIFSLFFIFALWTPEISLSTRQHFFFFFLGLVN